ncbi:MAG: hypothetical protein I3274_04815 [Candidatus Moeniiplasma glomeromycotorum]|nr:hypothetical protein [Candidatus Moeniiplasma glomeromycotorum]MCE8168267.1 hypothetical protein [Candidatus Moeniiplasma glomeromycotorum]
MFDYAIIVLKMPLRDRNIKNQKKMDKTIIEGIIMDKFVIFAKKPLEN